MKAYSTLYIHKLVDTLKNNLSIKENNIIFVKHYNTLNVLEEDVHACVDKEEDLKFLYHEFSSEEMQRAYEPFLEWIKELFEVFYKASMTTEAFLEACGVYKLHKDTIQSYLESGCCKRNEDIIVIEVEYEQRKFLKSLIDILLFISKAHPLLLVLNKLHLANYATLSFLLEFIQKSNTDRIALLVTYNEVFPISGYVQNIWKHLLLVIETENMLFDWGTLARQKTNGLQEVFVPKKEEIEPYILAINNMLCTLALEQATYYLQIIYQRIEREKLSVTLEQKRKICILYATISLYKGNLNQSLLLCENGINWSNRDDDLDMHFRNYYLLGLSQIYMMQLPLARIYAKECKNIAEKMQNEYLGFKAELLYYIAKFRGWKDIFLSDFFFEIEPKFLNNLEKYGYKNHLAYVYVYGFENDISSVPKAIHGEEMLEYLPMGVAIGQELGNINFLVAAYKKCVTVFEGFGRHEYVAYYYKKCIELLKLEKNKLEEGNIYNGLGYSCAVSEQYNQANDNFNEALKIMYEERIPENVAECLYNMGVNGILAGEYQTACEYLVLATKIIEILNLHVLRVCNLSKLYGLIAVCNYYMGVEYNCHLYLNKMQRIIYHLLYPEEEVQYYLWDDDLFLYYFVNALLCKGDEKLEEAQEFFDKATLHIERSQGFHFFSLPLWSVEQARLYKIVGEQEKAQEVLKKAIQYCDEKQYHYKSHVLQMEQTGSYEQANRWKLPLKWVEPKQILDLARQCNIEEELSNKAKDISFLSSWQDMLNCEDYTVDMLLKNAMSTLQNTFKLDSIFYIKMKDHIPHLEYCTKGSFLVEEDIKKIVAFFRMQSHSFLVNRIEKNFEDYRSILDVFGANKVVTLIGIPYMENERIKGIFLALVYMHRNFTYHRTLLGEEDLTILKFSFSQLLDALERLRTKVEMERMNNELKNMNERLKEIAITDLLTGLYNRQGFKHKLEKYYSKEYRKQETAILYLDLDNFKYYNDTFGHEIGDFVLILCANVFEGIVEKEGFAVRYGGDEFILVFPGKDTDFAVGIAKKIYQALEGGFVKEIQDKLKQFIQIPADKMISCSIGISLADKYTSKSMNEAICRADEALYFIKKTTKRNYMVWESTKE